MNSVQLSSRQFTKPPAQFTKPPTPTTPTPQEPFPHCNSNCALIRRDMAETRSHLAVQRAIS